MNTKFFVAGMADDEILTIHELSDYLKLNEKTAYRLVAKGDIPGFKVGGSWRFRKRSNGAVDAQSTETGGR